ncbi:hypothetical protein GPALN_003394 [Globodera pallida]|nr:hypothetical protein GPALN_003394 [Globodera pallida]
MKTEQQEHVYLWKITHPKIMKPSYLFGTMNLPWKALFKQFPLNIENIIKHVDVVVMEAIMPDKMSFVDEKEIEKQLPKEIINRVAKVLPSAPFLSLLLSPKSTERMLLYLIESKMQQQLKNTSFRYVDSGKLEDKIEEIGKNNGKGMHSLEDTQPKAILPTVSKQSKIALFEQLLDEIESDNGKYIKSLEDLVEWYKNGEYTEQRYENYLFGETMSAENENELNITRKEFMADLIGAHNKKWTLKMNEWMMMERNTGEKSFFFAVGLRHIITEHESLIKLLTNEGYKVEKVGN